LFLFYFYFFVAYSYGLETFATFVRTFKTMNYCVPPKDKYLFIQQHDTKLCSTLSFYYYRIKIPKSFIAMKFFFTEEANLRKLNILMWIDLALHNKVSGK